MGDLNTMSFQDAWHSDKFRALRRANLAENVAGTVCAKCLAYEDAEPAAQPVQFVKRAEGAPA
jgi:hypothetical protein